MHAMERSSWPPNQHHHAHHADERDWPDDTMADEEANSADANPSELEMRATLREAAEGFDPVKPENPE